VIGLAAEKGAAIAQVIIQTQAAVVAANAALAAIPPILPPGIPNPAYAAALALNAATTARLQIQQGVSIGVIAAQAIAGAYEGERRVGSGNERPQLPGTRDRYLRRVHKDEGIMDAPTNMKYLPELDMMRDGTYDSWVQGLSTPAPIGVPILPPGTVDQWITNASNINAYVEHHAAASNVSMSMPEFTDRGIVKSLSDGQDEARKQTVVLNRIASSLGGGRRSNTRR
jgi:hypothetical protein